MNSFIHWLMGEKAGDITINTYNWLLGKQPESSSQSATHSLETAEAALVSIRASVQKLSQAVSTQRAAYTRIKQKYDAKRQELEKLEQEAAIAQSNGDDSAARLAMARVIQLEDVLPQFENQVYQAQEYLRLFQEKLHQEQVKLETYETNIENIKDLQDVNLALETMNQVNQELEQVKFEVEQQNLEQQALADLALGSDDLLSPESGSFGEPDAIARRLQQLKSRSPQ